MFHAFCGLIVVVFVLVFGVAVLATGLGLIPGVVGAAVSVMCAVGVWGASAQIP
jgi:hypothetical protein